MKALSLKQPWAELVVSKKKTIELRKWNTQFRGDFLIHASKAPDKNAMKHFSFTSGSLPLGSIVGQANLVDVKKYNNKFEFSEDKNKHLATSDFGEYGFILGNIKRFEEPIAALGKLGFWDFNL